jgi:hypothetical protein
MLINLIRLKYFCESASRLAQIHRSKIDELYVDGYTWAYRRNWPLKECSGLSPKLYLK